MRTYCAEDYDPPERMSDLPLFAPQTRTLARAKDGETSKAAAVAISEHLTELQARVLAAFDGRKLTAKQAEALPEFADLGFSTCRKRISELASRGWLRATGTVVDGCAEYERSGA